MGNRGAARQNQMYGYGDPYLNQYGTGYGYGAQPGLAGYGASGPGYGYGEPGSYVEEPWAVTQWTEYYVPTVQGRQRRPVIYVAVPLPASNPCCSMGGYGGGFGGGLGGGFGGFGGGLPMGGFGGGLPLMGGFGGGLPMGGFGGGLPLTGGFGGGFPMGGFGGGLPLMGGGFGGGFPMGGGCGASLGYQALPMMTVAYGGGIPGVGGGFGGGFGGLPLF